MINQTDEWYLMRRNHNCRFDDKKCKIHHDENIGGWGHIFDCRYGKWAPELNKSQPPCNSGEYNNWNRTEESLKKYNEEIKNTLKNKKIDTEIPPLSSIGLRKKKIKKNKINRCGCKQ